MENLPRNLFDSEYYYKANEDVAKVGVDAYDHYFQHGINEKGSGRFNKTRQRRDACLKFDQLSLDQVRQHYYHTVPDDLTIVMKEETVGSLPFYLRSNMVSHFPVLEYYASQCKHITEFGVRHGQSTIAFLYGLPADGKLESYDIEETPFIVWLKSKNLMKWEFHQHNTADKELIINTTDLIFFDSHHSYEQVKNELEIHAAKSKKYLVFHDTFTCATPCEENSAEGIKLAIDEYMATNKCKIVFSTDLCNGLLILEK
jgi:hypothetical protein